jgi:GMP synthase (glutamine-hydrolysing)
MKPILFARCDAAETFGIAPSAVAAAGAEVEIWDALNGESLPEATDFSGIVMFGSSYNVEHADDQPFIKEARELTLGAIDRGVPYLGVCFGAQLLAWSLDAQVLKAPVREVGFEPIRTTDAATTDLLLPHYEDGDHVFQWHMDTFELPDGAVPIAVGDRVVNQAYRVGERTWGVQFHLEIDRTELLLWLEEFGAQDDLETTWGKSADQVIGEADRYLTDHERRGRQVFERFVRFASAR